MKPGWKTSEFWITLGVLAVASYAVGADKMTGDAYGMVVGALSLSYNGARAYTKGKQ